jgi:hypothetical protein
MSLGSRVSENRSAVAKCEHIFDRSPLVVM